MTRSPCELRLRRGTWSPEEDEKLMAYVQRYGHWNWNYVPIFAGLSRSGKSCRLRWKNYLRPNLRHGNFSIAEVEVIKKMQHELGNKWSMIASKLPGRTDNDIKNYWNTRLRKKTRHESSSSSSSGSGNDTFKNLQERSVDHFILASNKCTSESSNSEGFGLEEIIQMSSPQLSNLSYNYSFSSFDRVESDSTITEAGGTENMITSDISDEWLVRLLEEPFQFDPLFDDNGIW